MIALVSGTLLVAGTEAVVAIGGGELGVAVQLSARAAALLPPTGQHVTLWTHLIVREDSWSLFGFPSQEERAMFRLLISVSGIGPRSALSILSAASPVEIAGYLRSGDEQQLARLPGIGRKSAARLVVELGARVPSELVGEPQPAGDLPRREPMGADLQSAMAVLVSMGLPATRAEQALLSAKAQDRETAGDLESWVRAALRRL